MDRPTIWMIISTFYPVVGGAQSQVQRLAQSLVADGWKVIVLTRQHSYAHPDGLPSSEVIDGTPVRRLYSRGMSKVGSLLYVLNGLWYLLRHRHNGIYHAHDIGASGWLAVFARHLLGGRCLIKLRTGRDAYEGYISSRIMRWQLSRLLYWADRVIVVNSEVEEFVRNLGIPAKRVVRMPNAVDGSQFYPVKTEEKLRFRQQLNLSTEKTVVLYVGRLEQLKGVDILLRAWALLPEITRSKAKLVLVGDGPDRDCLCRMMASLGVDESVLMAGMQQSVRDYYWAADIFVLPSRTEGLSNALTEAMACGLPVLASNVGGALDIIEDGKNGILFKSEDETDLAHKLHELITAKSSWASLAAQARRRITMYADLATTLDRLHIIYHNLSSE